jgi:anthranilate/para-aminobenzoate synthase component II
MMIKVHILDFEDSFVYNLASELSALEGVCAQVIPFSDIKRFLEQFESKVSTEHQVVLFGPGPGHPDEYEFTRPSIRRLLIDQSVLLFGVCLGHQLIWQELGAQVKRSPVPMHGKAVSLHWDEYWREFFQFESQDLNQTCVQRYNSLSVQAKKEDFQQLLPNGVFLIDQGELMASVDLENKILTYQFHPESIGTKFSDHYFRCINRFFSL